MNFPRNKLRGIILIKKKKQTVKMTNDNKNIILENRKIIKRLLESDASVFCFFRMQTQKFNEPKYDSLEITINRDPWNVSLEFRLNIGGNEQGESRKFNLISQSIEEYDSSKLETYKTISDSGELDELEISRFVELKTFDAKNYLKFYTRNDFVSLHFNLEISSQRERSVTYANSCEWKVVYKYGLILKERYHSQRYSDFGNDNYLTIVLGNPAYFKTSKPEIFYNRVTPRDRYPVELFFWDKIYSYFFNEKKMILVNYDDFDKSFKAPQHLIEDSYVLSLNVEERDIPEFNKL